MGSSGSAPAYDSAQYYVVPVSLGSVPNVTGGCQIQPYEEDNLLDATQRHISIDWNTSIGTTPGVNDYLLAHIVDDPDHTTSPNTAGAIVVRDYLAPGAYCLTGASSCVPTNPPTSTPPYLIVRDVNSGCPYLAPQYNSLPGSDDSYIGGAVSVNDLSGMSGGSACGGGTGNGCVVRLRFKLPPNQATTPCAETPPNNAPCNLQGNVDLRYMSITFL